ncbi:hypothetical protein CSW08_16415 [Confluentibacter flavum]|uniref:Uncharacterized protein n=1 Tax=Confluentibacter flavum TaxID=1909700 RepID=A0A2N3HF29_9FLAO|nr:hypothetical protein CSW08_16415 [Confluentibacter flavum]
MLAQNMATECSKNNIQINTIDSVYFATAKTGPIHVGRHPFNYFIINRTPTSKWENHDDLAETVIFLSSKADGFFKDPILYVEGRLLATIGMPSK